MKPIHKIAVVGGGLSGCLAALELCERRHSVVLFEKASELLTRASIANEGKIHLGYVYAADSSFRTADLMINDALQFRSELQRWMSSKDFDFCLFDAFHYVVPNSTNLPVEQIRAHFARVDTHIKQRESELNLDYLGQGAAWDFHEVQRSSDSALACFATQEKGVWPVAVANLIRSSVTSHPNITVETNTRIDQIVSRGEKWAVQFTDLTRRAEGPFDIVVNAAWADRRNIDWKSGFTDQELWFTRYKFGAVLENATEIFGEGLPRNTTALSGAYGDSVYYPQNDSLYCSWYPVGRQFSTPNLFCDKGPFELQDKAQLARDTWKGYASIDPTYEKLEALSSGVQFKLIGDYIMAQGNTDIESATSGLHERFGYGPVELSRGYWTLETGKYTSAPRCAAQCAKAVLGED